MVSLMYVEYYLHTFKCITFLSALLPFNISYRQLYRSSSSNNIPSGAAEEAYGEYAASDSDIMELTDKVCVKSLTLGILYGSDVKIYALHGSHCCLLTFCITFSEMQQLYVNY